MSKLLNKILDRQNLLKAYKQVVSRKGTAGIDDVTVEELGRYIRQNWKTISRDIRERSYTPQPVQRVEIPKPEGGVRMLGIPTAIDRVIQQAIAQILSPKFEVHFSDNSFGFRPGRSCEMAIQKLLNYFNEGSLWVVDIDLEKFFDCVPHDKLMTLVRNVIEDPDTESLIHKYLRAGVIINGKFERTSVGMPQGGNLSPLLSNIMLNELDKELEKRGHNFVRYADDCLILVRSEASAKRTLRTITHWIERKLDLKVNATKSKITRPTKLKYLGFGFHKDSKANKWKSRPHKDSITSFKQTLKRLTSRRWSVNLRYRVRKLNEVIRGWINYFSTSSMRTHLKKIDAHLRTRLRVCIWKMWKVPARREWGLKKLGIGKDLARLTAYCGDRYIWVATKTCLTRAISKEKLGQAGLVNCLEYYNTTNS